MAFQMGAVARRLRGVMVIAVLMLMGGAPTPAAAQPQGGYIVVDMHSGAILDAYRSGAPMRPASLTKMMTLYLAFEAISEGRLRWNQTLTVSAHAASMQGRELYLRRGDQMTVREAVLATAIYSANDASVLLAEAIAGSESAFAQMMTAKARQLGMADTTFGTASGLFAPDQFTTPYDMAVLARRLYFDFPDQYEIFGRTSFRLGDRSYSTTNGILNQEGVDGMKTGYTSRAGYNLAASAERSDRRILVVLMGATSVRKRNNAVLALLDDGFVKLRELQSTGGLTASNALTTTTGGAPLLAPPPTPRALYADAPSSISAATPATTPATAPPTAFASVDLSQLNYNDIETHSITPAADPANLGQSVASNLALRAESATWEGGGGPAANWSVQIGAFREEQRAADLLRDVLFRHSNDIAGAFQSIVPHQQYSNGQLITLHRARFTGLDQMSALQLCTRMAERGAPCLVVPPQGWTN